MATKTVNKGNDTKAARTKQLKQSDVSAAAVIGQHSAAEGALINKKRPVPTEINPNQVVTVRNGFHGQLVYKSKRTGEFWVWDSFGAEQDMELSELKNARNSSKKFFANNWFMFDEDWIIDYLGVKQYYKYAIPIQNFDDLFKKAPAEIEETISRLSGGQRKSIAYRARQLIAEGGIDSNKVIATLERCLNTELIER